MQTSERIVESYFRLCKGCFTYPDVKVKGGNNRQLDLLAYNIREDTKYHVETSVTHELSWRATWENLERCFEKKFFGAPARREGPNTDYSRGKNYFAEIKKTYKMIGFAPREVQRVWITWVIPDEEGFGTNLRDYSRRKRLGQFPILVMSFRDEILPTLLSTVGKSNYDDDVLRTLSLIRQFERQAGFQQTGNRQRVIH